jgi:hypothetical protein
MKWWSKIEGDALYEFRSKSRLFDRQRAALGIGGVFSARNTAGANYTWIITEHGYDRIAGETPEHMRRTGRRRITP